MPLDGFVTLDEWPSTLTDCRQWVEQASRAEFDRGAAFAVGVREEKVVAWHLHDIHRDVKILTEAAQNNPRVRAELQGGYAYFLQSINQSRHQRKAKLIAGELAPECDLGQPLTSRRILSVAEFLDSDMPTLPLLDDPEAWESARQTAMRQAHAAYTAGSAGEDPAAGRTASRPVRPQHSRIDATAIHHRARGRIPSIPKVSLPQTHLDDWQAFECWCTKHSLLALPASEETVAAFLGMQSRLHPSANIHKAREIIAQMHATAGFPNSFESKVVENTLHQPKGKAPVFSPKHLNAAAVAAIRETALTCRQFLGKKESEHIALYRGTVDIALCSLLHATSMSPETAALLEWRHVCKTGNGTAMVLIPRSDARRLGDSSGVPLPDQVYREVEAVRENEGSYDKVFGISGSAIRGRISEAAKRAGLKVPRRR